MPTGLTYKISEQDDASFEDFVWRCARHTGALIHMRDDRADAEPVLPKKSEYYVEALVKANENLVKYKKMTLDEVVAEFDQDFEELQKNSLESIQKSNALRKRYETMLVKVKAWEVPSPDHQGLKDLMISQLNDSIEYDCNTSYYEDQLLTRKVSMETAAQWLIDQIRSAEHDVIYYTKKIEDEEANHERIKNFIEVLNQSVPFPKNIGT